ncbi:MAG: two-component sensor histidine kinase, partial [Prevotellaceae bacterium]|nr:two-component sensor histidine kinase [Prevotellaceae bacterium]
YQDYSDTEEVVKALAASDHVGIARRLSTRTGVRAFYVATAFPQCIVRTSQAWTKEMDDKFDVNYLGFGGYIFITILLSVVIYRATLSHGRSLRRMRKIPPIVIKTLHVPHELSDFVPQNDIDEATLELIKICEHRSQIIESVAIEREKLLAYLYTVQQGVGIFAADGKEILLNSLFIQYANLISDKQPNNGTDILRIEELQPIVTAIHTAQESTQQTHLHHTIRIAKDGRYFDVSGIVFSDQTFEISITDITQTIEQEELKRELTQNINHELKTPVSSIHAYLETLIENPRISDEQRKLFLHRCFEQSTRLTLLLRDVSTLTRIDEAPNMFEKELIDLCKLVDTIISEEQILLNEKHITTYNQLQLNTIIRGNQMLLYSLFRNLIDNSIAYAGTDINIYIQCIREDENFYYFDYSDTGIGVDTIHLQRIFNRFYRVNKGRSRKQGGTGLGLAIVRNAVLIHGGNIYAKNRQEGGLEFVFTLSKEL